jgi:hypothetical protein
MAWCLVKYSIRFRGLVLSETQEKPYLYLTMTILVAEGRKEGGKQETRKKERKKERKKDGVGETCYSTTTNKHP